jgi:hypothetical protein
MLVNTGSFNKKSINRKVGEFDMKRKCPVEEKLAGYLEQRLSEKERIHLEAHLSECDLCMEELVAVQSISAEWPASEHVPVPGRLTRAAMDRVQKEMQSHESEAKQWISRSAKGMYRAISDNLPAAPWRELSLATVRGSKKRISKDHLLIKRSFKGFNCEIEIEKTSNQIATIRVKLISDNGMDKDLRGTLKKGVREISSELFSRKCIALENIPFGHYTLAFSRNELSMGSYDLEIEEMLNE